MGNAIVKRSKRITKPMMSAKVVMTDGSLAEFKEPITVAELMMEYPQHLVCRSTSSSSSGSGGGGMQSRSIRLPRKSASPADVQLEVGHLYYLLPASQFQSPPLLCLQPAQKLSGTTLDTNSKGGVRALVSELLLLTKLPKLQEKNNRRTIEPVNNSQELPAEYNRLVNPLLSAGLRITRDDDIRIAAPSETMAEEEEEEDVIAYVSEELLPIVSFSTPSLRSMYMNNGAGAQPILTRTTSWKPRLETIQEARALSRRRFHNFVRGRRSSRNQVHEHLNIYKGIDVPRPHTL